MHFYRVPRLGAYLAIPLEYNSCLSEKALDQAITDYNTYIRAVQEQDRQRKEWDEETERIREEKERAGESFIAEDREWPVIEEKPFVTRLKRFVVGLDTLGQDREFTFEQRRFALETVNNFAAIWEKREQENLVKDRNLRLEMIELDKEYLENVAKKLEEDSEEHFKAQIETEIQQSDSQKQL
jgi:hypothetical protein